MKKGMRLSWITIGWGAYIVLSAAFMNQVSLWLASTVGDSFLEGSFWALSILILIAAVAYTYKAHISILRAGAVICVFILMYLLSAWQQYFADKTHILSYGLLGYLASRDLAASGTMTKVRDLAAVMAFVIFISACDEIFQWLLPYRTGEMKDLMTDIVSGALGACLFMITRKSRA